MSGTQRNMALHGTIVSILGDLEQTILTNNRPFQSPMSVLNSYFNLARNRAN